MVGKVHRTGTLADPIRGLVRGGRGTNPNGLWSTWFGHRTSGRGAHPLREEGGIVGFLKREVLPYAPDAWYRYRRV